MKQEGRLQLPVLRKKIPPDAARAVNRKGELRLQRVNAETLNELLNFPGMRITHIAIEAEGQTQCLHLFCEHRHQGAICPECLHATDKIHEIKDRCVRHLDIWGVRTVVHFPHRRFDCASCGKPF